MTITEFRKQYKALEKLNGSDPVYRKAWRDYKAGKISSNAFWKIGDKDANRHYRLERKMEKLIDQFIKEALK